MTTVIALASRHHVKKRRTADKQLSERRTAPPKVLSLLRPIVDYSTREDPKYNYAKHLEAFAENLEKQVPLVELAERAGVKTTKAPRLYDRSLHRTLFKETVKKQHGRRAKVIVSLDESLKQMLRQQTNLSDIVIALEDSRPYSELKIRLGGRKSFKEESSEVVKALGFLVDNSKLQGISSLIMKHHGEAYMAKNGSSHVSYAADFVQFDDSSQRFFEPVVYTGKDEQPSVEVNGKPIQDLGFKIEEKVLESRHFKLPKTFILVKADTPKNVPFMQHYYSVSSFRPLQVYSLKYSKMGAIPICRKGEKLFLCFDFWLAYEESTFTIRWDKRLPLYPAKERFASVIAPVWIPHREKEEEHEEFKLLDKTRELGLRERRKKRNLYEVKTKAGKLDEMRESLVQSRVAKPPWRIRFEFSRGPQFAALLTYQFEESCDNCPLLKA